MRIRRALAAPCVALFVLAALTPAVQAAPDIVVRIDGTEVENHHEHVFDDTVVGDGADLIVVVRNQGSEDLVFTETPPVTISGGFPDQYELVQPALEAGGKLSPNGSTAFRVTFRPEIHFASLFTHLYLWTNASATPFHLVVRGRSLAPVLEVRYDGEAIATGHDLEIPRVVPGENAQYVFTVRNAGDAPLHFTGDPLVELLGDATDQFVIVPPALEAGALLSPNGSTAFAVRYEPNETPSVAHAVDVRVETDDLDGAFIFSIATQPVSADVESWGRLKAGF